MQYTEIIKLKKKKKENFLLKKKKKKKKKKNDIFLNALIVAEAVLVPTIYVSKKIKQKKIYSN